MDPRLSFAVRADYDGRWTTQVINDARKVAGGVRDAGNSMGQSLHGASAQVGNLAAQFNDIGVTLASDNSPFLIALQQGSQIGQVLGPLGAGGAVKALGTAFMSLLSPVNLITIGAIAAGGALVQWFMSLNRESPKAEDRLEAHTKWLHQILEGYDDAKDAADRYLLEAAKLPVGAVISDVATARTAAIKGLDEALKHLKTTQNAYLEDKTKNMWDTADAVAQAKALSQIQVQLDVANPKLDELITNLTEIKNSAVNDKLREAAEQMLKDAESARSYEKQISSLAAAYGVLSAAAAGLPPLPESYTKALDTLSGLGQPQLDDRQKAAQARNTGLAGAQDQPTRIAVQQQYNDAIARISTREAEEEALKRNKEFESDAKRQADAYRTVIDSLALQTEAVGLNATEQEKLNQIHAAGVDANSKEAEAIRTAVDALYLQKDATDVINSLKSPADVVEEQIDRLRELWQAGAIDADQYAQAVAKAMATVPDITGQMVGKVGDILGSFSTLTQTEGEKGFQISKAFSLASAVLKGYEAVTSSYAAGAKIGGPVVGALFAAAAVAATAAQISNILGTTSKSTSMKGSSGGGAAASAPAAAAAPAAIPQQAINVIFQGRGSTEMFMRQFADDLAGAINNGAGSKLINVIKAA